VARASGGWPSRVGLYSSISGSTMGSWSFGTHFTVPSPSSIVGNGSPQYRWRENNQSRSR
jgi:hypothetical protein